MTESQGKKARFANAANQARQEIHGQVMEWRPRCDVQSVDDTNGGAAFLEANFLSPNTDLNLPPSNWLRSSSQVERYIRDSRLGFKQAQTQFSSFTMGNRFPEFIGQVDVISDAENIKKLLKIPYNKAHISMMVHRIRKTLLLDDFDIHKQLLRQQQEDWKWMKKFYEETVAENREEKMKCVPKKNKSRDHLQNLNLYSKFLYYSVSDTDSGSAGSCDETAGSTMPDHTPDSDLQTIPHSIKQPGGSGFHREVLWTFEDIQMLIGTDLPIFRAGHHPCVSVRLRDMSKPVNVLTGMDYWLDNLMCNVPELAMCYHLNGIVQNYELIKTPDIPDLHDSKFSPQEVTDIAKNILSFLKSNATKEGHTYWLYKGVDDDVVKLYDLTTLCADDMEHKGDNPFTVPLGMLLYRVARNMRERTRRKHASTIRMLLNTCLMLLDEDEFPQVYTSANYWLSDLYVPDSVVTDVWALSANSEESDSDCEDMEQDEGRETSNSVRVQTLSQPDQVGERKRSAVVKFSSALFGTAEEKCRESLKCIHKGVLCLNKHSTAPHDQEEEQATCNPDEAIPMFYQPLHTKTGDGEAPEAPPDTSLSAFRQTSPSRPSPERWHLLLKVLLYRKASMAYYSLAVVALEGQKYGMALRHIKLAILCFYAMRNMSAIKGEENGPLLCSVLGTLADIRLIIAHNTASMEILQHDLYNLSSTDTQIMQALEEDLPDFERSWMYALTDSVETNLSCSAMCYEEAMQLAESKGREELLQSLTKRFGNAKNELGVLYMNKALAVASGAVEWRPLDEMESVWKLSYGCFDRGVSAFQSIGDVANQALLLSNIGQLMRICAQCHSITARQQPSKEFSAGERHYYTKAIMFYIKALTTLGSRTSQPQIWDNINWELSTTYFNMAMLLQDHAPVSVMSLEEVEKEIIDLMTKALKHCEGEKSGPQALSHQYRAATINHRLASLHHSAYRNQAVSEQKRRYLRQLAVSHYDKAATLYQLTDSHNDLLRVQLEKVALCEFTFEEAVGFGAKCRVLEETLRHLFSCQPALHDLQQLCTENTTSDDSGLDTTETNRLLDIFKSRLQHVLLSLIKQYSKIHKSKETESEKVGCVKQMYSRALQGLAKDDSPVWEKCRAASEVLSQLDQVWKPGGS